MKTEFKLAISSNTYYHKLMIVQFSARNFKSFKDSFVLDLFTNKDSAVSSLYNVNGTNIYPSAVFYGANASGKSNILKAFSMMRRLVLNQDKIIQSTDILPTNRFRLSTTSENDTTAFDVCFVFEGKKYKYGFEYDETCVYSEYLYFYDSVQPTTVFEYDVAENNGTIKITRFKELKKINHLKNSLFLLEADRYGNEEAKQVLKWFSTTHIVEFSPTRRVNPDYYNLLLYPEIRNKFIGFINNADFGIKDIFQETNPISDIYDQIPNFPKNTKLEEIYVKTIHSKVDENNNFAGDVEFDLFEDESLGTRKIFEAIGPIIDTLQKGAVLFLDELDASLHPILTRKIVELFNNAKSNPHGAQLIFTSQDTNLLDQTLFDKEQIWFIEKDKFGASHLVSLAEYKDVRKEHKIERNYILGKYGAIPYLGDFSF